MSDTPRTDAVIFKDAEHYRVQCQQLEQELNEEKRQFRILFDVAKTRTEERDEAKALGDERDEWRKQARELAIEVFALRDRLRAEVEWLKNELAQNNSAACAWDRQVAINERDQFKAEVDLLKVQLSYCTNERDQWRAVAEQQHEALQTMTPAKNCSCHLNPPCNQCVEHGLSFDAIAAYEKLKAKP